MKTSIKNHQSGTVVMLASVALVGIMLVTSGVVVSRKVWRENAAKLLMQESAKEIMYSSANDLCAFLTTQLESSAMVNLAQTPFVTSGMTVQVDNENATQPYTFGAQSSGVITAIQSGTNFVRLTDPNDPLYGVSAIKKTISCQQTASLTTESPLGARVGRGIWSNMQLEVRQFPLSQFTYYSVADAELSGSIGRTHVSGSLTITDASLTDYPLTCGKKLAFGRHGAVSVKQNPTATSSGVSAVTDADTKRVLLNSVVVDDEVQKSNIKTAASITQMVATPATNLGSTAKNNQKLCNTCDIWIYYDSTANTFSATTPAGVSNTAIKNAMACYSGTLEATVSPHKVIEFDVTKLTAASSAQKRYYIYSSDPDAIVMIRNGEILSRDISIVTPLNVWVDTAFNAPADSSKIKAASIITGARVCGVGG